MDVLLLGAAAIVLIALTLWIVWRPVGADEEEGSEMMPQGDRFEDQYTSATADLSAGGIAVTGVQDDMPVAAEVSDFQRAGEPWSEPTLAREGVSVPEALPNPARPALPEPSGLMPRRTMSIGAAALLTLGGAIGGAWLYSRWQHARNRPINRLLRRFK